MQLCLSRLPSPSPRHSDCCKRTATWWHLRVMLRVGRWTTMICLPFCLATCGGPTPQGRSLVLLGRHRYDCPDVQLAVPLEKRTDMYLGLLAKFLRTPSGGRGVLHSATFARFAGTSARRVVPCCTRCRYIAYCTLHTAHCTLHTAH